MRCPSCDAASESSSSRCLECGVAFDEESDDHHDLTYSFRDATMNSASEIPNQPQIKRPSTLIDFPGVTRSSVPQWRKELSERVREVQERRAREAREAAEAGQDVMASQSSAPQLELLPQSETPQVNPLVAAALKRIERAHLSVPVENHRSLMDAATAVAYAPEREDNEAEPDGAPPVTADVVFDEPLPVIEREPLAELRVEKNHGLVVVTPTIPVEMKTVPLPVPRRLIVDDDPVLNYLDSIPRTVLVDELTTNRASNLRRLICGLLDLLICAILSSPVPLAIRFTGSDFHDPRAIGVIVGIAIVTTFIYLTLTTALTGRTWAMRVLALRVIDLKTGLIPTGRQSAGRAFFYLVSLATAGMGILFALISREGYTVHDRVTRTAVVIT